MTESAWTISMKSGHCGVVRVPRVSARRQLLTKLWGTGMYSKHPRGHSLVLTVVYRVLHEMGGLLSAAATPFSPKLVPPETMADILANLYDDRITGTTAKQLLAMVFNGDKRVINTIIKAENLELQHLSRDEYLAMAQTLIDKNAEKVQQIQQKRQMGKLMWFVGQMMRRGEGKVEANKAEATLKELLGLD